jgi:hypothetical protein
MIKERLREYPENTWCDKKKFFMAKNNIFFIKAAGTGYKEKV